MKELTGYDRRRWLTGFTNYRFAIPELADRSGRAIYNDVDQIYLADPGELFDWDLAEHGFLSIAENDSSVMLMDCEKMGSIWTIERARQERKSALLNEALSINNLWGRLESEWNARDEEYVAGKSKVLHYTALHTQPWHPFPQEFVYQESPVGHVWHELEESAHEKGFQLFSRTQPSSQFAQLAHGVSEKKSLLNNPSDHTKEERGFLDLQEYISGKTNPRILYYHSESASDHSIETTSLFASNQAMDIQAFNWCSAESSRPQQPCDIVYGSDELTWLPNEDTPWVLEEMFSLASRLVYITVHDMNLQAPIPSYFQGQSRDFHWWAGQLQAISTRYPSVHWTLHFQTANRQGQPSAMIRHGGRWLTAPPRVWILSDGKTGHSTQSETLAQSLGWPYDIKQLHFHGWNNIQKLCWSLLPPHIVGLKKTAFISSCPTLAGYRDFDRMATRTYCQMDPGTK